MKKKAAKKKVSAFRKRRNIDIRPFRFLINAKDKKFIEFMAKASREGKL